MLNSWGISYALSLLGVTLFAASYYWNCYRKGYRIDLWHAHLFLFCFFPYMLMLAFARSELNGLIVGNDFYRVVAASLTEQNFYFRAALRVIHPTLLQANE